MTAPSTEPVIAAAGVIAAAVDDRSARGIAATVHRLIATGRLPEGARLPTVRDLARALGVSPATVNEAWRALAAAGVLRARGRAGTFVMSPAAVVRPARYLDVGGVGAMDRDDVLNLATGTPDPALLPEIRSALERVVARPSPLTTSYLDDPVLPELEEILRADWPFVPERLTVVDGALDALSRIVDEVVRLGDRVAVEDPGFPPLIDLLERAGAQVVPLALDDSGVTSASLQAALALEPVAVFLQPRAQNPTGVSMSTQRAAALAEMVAATPTLIVEDDHSGEIATGEDVSLGRFVPELTVHIRSYSKSHGPDLRIAAVGGRADVVGPLVSRRMLGPGWTSRLLQAVLVELLTDPAAVAAVDRARAAYAMRSLAVRAGLAGRGVTSTPGDGINAWVRVRDERAALLSLAARGIRASPGSPFTIGPGDDHVRVTTGQLDEHDADLISHVIEALSVAAVAEPTIRGV